MEFLPLIFCPINPSMLNEEGIGSEDLIKADNLQVRTTKQGFGVYLHEISFLYTYDTNSLNYLQYVLRRNLTRFCIVYHPLGIINRDSESKIDTLAYILGRDGGLHFELRNIVRDRNNSRPPKIEVVLSAIDTKVDLDRLPQRKVEIPFEYLEYIGTPHHG